MTARVSKKAGHSPEVLGSNLRPLCRAVAMVVTTLATSAAHAAGIVNLSHVGVQMNAAQNAAAGLGTGASNFGMSPQQALQASQPAIRNLAHAAQGIAQQIAAQQAAAAAAGLASTVPNGLVGGGLQAAPGATSNSTLWLNASLPTQTVGANGQTTVDVKQNAQDAILTWQTMNVGRQTTLNFDQSGGNQTSGANNWVVLNRIEDPSGRPSQILGNIKAQGTVLVINRNGILFGAGSQVNVHSLVASSLDVLNTSDDLVQTSADIAKSNNLFLTGGLAALEEGHSQPTGATNGNPNEILGLGNQVSVSSANDYQAPGDITIAPGASITTHANGTASDGGLVLIAAPNVNNGGSITATDGQVILAAGIGVSLVPNQANPQVLQPRLTGSIFVAGTTTDITPVGTLTNTGIVQTARGNIALLGTNVIQNGVVGTTTSVSEPGGIVISTVDENLANTPTGTEYISGQGAITPTNGGNETNRAGQLIFGDGSVTTIMPDGNGVTATSAPGTTFTPGSINMTAGSVWFQPGSLIEAPGSTVSVTALAPLTAPRQPAGDTAVQGRIYLDTGATIDVSGLSNVELPIANELITIPLIGQNELADSPLLRDGFLFGLKNVVVDSTLSGTNPDGSHWIGSPILNLAGYADLIPRSVDQLLINGGTITLSGAQVMTAGGSSLNLNGGYLHYDGGIVNTTRLVDAGGAIVSIGNADPFDTYVGIAGEFIETHPRWGVTKDWFNPSLSGGTFESDFIVGGNAGTLNIFASQALVLDGDITAQAFGGSKQVQGNDQPTGGSFNLGAQVAGGTFGANSGASIGESGTVILQNSAPQLSNLGPGFSANTPLDMAALNALAATDPNNVLANTVVPTDTLNGAGFANVSVNDQGGSIVVVAGTTLEVQPGGSIELNVTGRGGKGTAPITIFGDLIAPSGTISITNAGDIEVGPDALISVAGQWVNNATQSAPGTQSGDSEFIDGGSIVLSTTGTTSTGGSAQGTDSTGSIILQQGSVIDVSSGGEMQADGQMLMQDGIPEGMGGSLSLLTYADIGTAPFGAGGAAPQLPMDQPTSGRIEMDGTIRSAGFAGGGTLTLQALGFQIGGDPAQAPAWYLALPADFFARQGFGKYVLNAIYDATVAPGTQVQLTQQNLLPNAVALQSLSSGADLWASDLTSLGTLDPFHRQATDLVMTAGAYLAWVTPTATRDTYPGVTGGVTVGEGASIVGDAGASIGLGSPAQVTVLGSIVAPGGDITLSADSERNGFAQPGQFQGNFGYTSPGKSVWLGANAVLDVAGVALVNPLADPVKNGLQTIVPHTGTVLPGGSVTLSDDSGYIVTQAGSAIDVSGTSATFDELQSSGRYAPQQVWSDAGSITVGGTSGLYLDGTLRAQPGAKEAQGGTLTLIAEQGATAFVIRQSGEGLPEGLTPASTFGGVPAGVLQFAADRLTGSGLSTFVLNGITAVNGSFDETPVPVAFTGDVNLNMSNSVVIEAQQVVALSGDQVSQLLTIDPSSMQFDSLASVLNQELSATGPTAIGAPTVTIDAPYVAIVGPVHNNVDFSGPVHPVKALADGTLNINASFIDLENQVQLNNFQEANFTSSGDIRLSSTVESPAQSNALTPGVLFTSGNLTFKAADVYPSTGSTFILDAAGPDDGSGNPLPTTITFLSNGSSEVPLSAGGTLLVDASDIVQSGTVRAPSGSLIFGVGNPKDGATLAEFINLPLVATNSVSLTLGSVTSVSLEGAIVPYGTTVDGVEWQFNPVAGEAAPDVTAPPSKFVSVNGTNISLNPGATIDLSGGGNLQAEEWVPGTGGSRDLLSQYNVSFAENPGGAAIPVNPAAGNVYAILPGRQSPVAAYDPIFAQTTQPLVSDNGSVSTTTDSIGVGRASLSDSVGQSVYLSGVPGLPAGYYTLLPGKYATLPGAFRVTMSGASGPVLPGVNGRLPDGTEVVAGYLGNALDGSHGATPMLFDVQSGSVWQQYSQYTLTSANNFFPALAAGAGHVTPQLPMDAGHLVIAATTSLSLGATLNAAPADGGAPAEVDIASQDIQVLGNGEAALPGYLTISSEQLAALGAGSLLLGGTRTQTDSGITINAIANSLVISNDAADPLTGPEVMLVTKTDSTGTDPNAANGIRIDSGSVIAASGSYPAAKDVPITIGVALDSNGAGGVSGDGAFLSVSNGGDSVVTRVNTTPASSNTGLLTVDAGATLSGGQALTLDSSGNLTFDPSANLSGNIIAVDASAITFTSQTGPAAAALPGFVAGASQIAQLANAQEVILRSSGTMYFDGTVDVTFGNDVDLSAGTYSSNGGSVTINAPRVAFTNELGAPASTVTAGPGTLTVNASEIDFGTGDKTTSGLSSATFNATGGIVGQGVGTFDFGALPVTLNAPVYLADTGSEATLRTTGALNLNHAAGTALALQPLGGAWSFVGGTLNDNSATIVAPGGNVSLEATAGDLTVAEGSVISTSGVALPFFDVTVYAPAGAIALTADTGTVNVAAGSTLDFSGANGGGAAGSLTVSAPDQTVKLDGTLKGAAAAGYLGGSFSINTGGAIDLDSLAAELASSGVNDAITVQTNTGNLVLSADNTITAHAVSLTADGGPGGNDTSNGYVQILGTIDASGNAGGEIDLYGKSGVDLEGSLIATGSSGTQRGGTVNFGTTAIGNNTDINSTYGYENIASAQSGSILLGGNASIDVSGGTAGGLSGGTVNFRAPLVGTENGPGSVNITIAPGAQIKGSRATTVEAYATWSTDDQSTGAQHFDGIVDPAGWYDSKGNLEAGIFTGQSGNAFTFTPDGTGGGSLTGSSGTVTVTAAQLMTGDTDIGFGGLDNDFFSPAAANPDHQSFYGYQVGGATATTAGTLMGFVQAGVQGVANQFAGNGIANFAVVPGIELDNPDPAINSGNISILTNWNLGAGTSPNDGAFRFDGRAPTITFRAENNVKVDASLTDGFFQISNPTASPLQTITITPPTPASHQQGYFDFYYNSYYAFGQKYGIDVGPKYGGPYSVAGKNAAYFGGQLSAPAMESAFAGGDPQEIAQYYGLYKEYIEDAITNGGTVHALMVQPGHFGNAPVLGQPVFTLSAPSAADELANPGAYQAYLTQYNNYAAQLTTWMNGVGAGNNPNVNLPFQIVPLGAPPVVLTTLIQNGSTTVGSVATDNSPSPIANSGNGLPLASATLSGGASSSFRLVAGANLSSANPLALQAAALFSPSSGTPLSGGGNVTLDGHFAYDNENNPVNANTLSLLAPTTIRTGVGSIDIAAGNDIALLDSTAPGVIYTAGAPAAGAPIDGAVTIVAGDGTSHLPNILVTTAVNPDSAGDISIHAQNDIVGVENAIDTNGAVSGSAGGNISQFWWQWMQIQASPTVVRGENTQITHTSIDFGAFDQGVMSVGGNVSVSAGGNISDLAVSLPTTWYLNSTGAPVTIGGGNLNVAAGGDILSGDYFVAKGTGTLVAGGKIGLDPGLMQATAGSLAPIATLLATQDGVLDISARQGADIGGVFDPSYIENQSVLGTTYHQHVDDQGYSSTSAVNIQSTTGDVDFGTLPGEMLPGGGGYSNVLPATVNLTAFTGGITIASGGALFPSATGNLSLIADQSIDFQAVRGSKNTAFGMLDAAPSSMPSPVPPQVNPDNEFPTLMDTSGSAHAVNALHDGDAVPVRIYSLTGSIVDGILEPADSIFNPGFYDNLINVVVDKPALIEADQDIVNLVFQGQNLRDDDITRIVAGHDIDDTPLVRPAAVIPSLQLGGPGTLDVEAGRNVGPLTSQADAFAVGATGFPTGIEAVGNANNPNLPHESADVHVLFGVGPGIDDANFISTYVNPASSVAGVPSAAPALIAFMEQYEAGQGVDTGLQVDKAAAQANAKPLTAQEAWSQFQTLPVYVQQLFAEQVLFSVLTDVGNDFNNSSSPFFQQYARGYQAINTLFPASLGYTANDLGGGANGANKLVSTGNLDIRSTTIQTQQGGNVSILGPGGEALIGSTSAPPAIVNSAGQIVAGPGTQGILTLEQGDIDIFTDQSLLLAQSRVFTEQGGAMTIWSSNGDINAGKGAKSAADVPPPQYVCDVNHYCTVDARGEVTGAGIATLQTIPGAQAGDVNLIAPRGTVDAGDAGIRVSGNLNVAALHVANVDNIQVQGKSAGIPVVSAVDTGALTAASSATSAVTQMAQNLVRNNASGVSQRHWIITVQVEGFGDGGTLSEDDARRRRKQ